MITQEPKPDDLMAALKEELDARFARLDALVQALERASSSTSPVPHTPVPVNDDNEN